MLRTVFLREMLEALVSRKFLFIVLLCSTLIPLSVLVNQRNVDRYSAHQSQAEADYQRTMQGFTPTDQVEVKVFRRKPELAALATGLDLALPSTVTLRQRGASFGMGQSLDNPVTTLFGKIDLLFLVKFVLSLVAIILSFDMICGEKERGTLRLVLSNPVARDSVLFGKYLSALVTLLVPLAIGLLLSVLILQLQGSRALSSFAQWLSLGFLFVVAALYLSSFLSLGALVSSRTGRPLTAITVLLFLWAGLVAIVPQVGGLLAESLYPVGSAESVLLRKSMVEQDIERRRTAELRPHFKKPDYEEIRKPVAARYERERERALHRIDQEYENRRRNQFRIASIVSSISPATPLTFAFTSLSGTGVLQADHFNRRLDSYRSRLQNEIFSRGYRDLLPGVGGAMLIDTVELEDVPLFEYKLPSLEGVLRSVWPQLVLLAVFNLALFFAAYLSFRRYDVR